MLRRVCQVPLGKAKPAQEDSESEAVVQESCSGKFLQVGPVRRTTMRGRTTTRKCQLQRTSQEQLRRRLMLILIKSRRRCSRALLQLATS